MKVIAIITVFIVIGLIQTPKLVRKKQWPELIASSLLLFIGFILSFLQVIGADLPNPNKGIQAIIRFFIS
ncbi:MULTISPECIES: hypothetical protein [Desulfitobacterium]|uniref:Uncharacterized protein n=1 Tax=Desulfitobacterium dehalogenans (strain ATCC 51507 / DSM 9161 / JW/IU-DC1) TaxID=756499 RepID=I4A440_DESDJ|nr:MULTISPECIES: hypothetical protein [Desulfitobacterium]AFL98724.1 hypothetical protein Desde_0253 [Desulfitobacterium dehalogenans ATCC 51507]